MKLSIHPDIKGKPKQTEHGYFLGTKKINLGYGWMNVDVDWDQAFELITTDGYATSCELSTDNRKEEYFVSRQLFMVDVDDGMTIQQLLQDDFYNQFAAGFYTTARHTDDNHRFRIMFITEEPITDVMDARKITRGLLTMFSAGDISCKDASRLYYGVPNSPIKESIDRKLSTTACNELIRMIDDIDKEAQKTIQTIVQLDTVDEEYVDHLLNKIAMKYGSLKGDYNQWLSIAWATCHSVGLHQGKNLMLKHFYQKTKKESHAFNSWNKSSSPTIGTLIKLSGISSTEKQLLELQMKLRKMK